MTDRHVFVYVDLDGKPQLVGQLWGRMRKGKESATFEYDDAWLKHPARYPLQPALALTATSLIGYAPSMAISAPRYCNVSTL